MRRTAVSGQRIASRPCWTWDNREGVGCWCQSIKICKTTISSAGHTYYPMRVAGAGAISYSAGVRSRQQPLLQQTTLHSTLSLSLSSLLLSLSGAALLADDLLPLTADRYPFSTPQSPCPSPPFAPRSAAADRYPLAVPATITIRRPGVPRTRDGAGHPARHRRAFPKKLVFFLISLATTCRSLVYIAQPINKLACFTPKPTFINLHQLLVPLSSSLARLPHFPHAWRQSWQASHRPCCPGSRWRSAWASAWRPLHAC